MKKTTKLFSIILALMLILGVAMAISFTVGAEGAKTPEYLESYQWIVGNGTPLYIVSGTGGGTAVYYMNGSTKIYVNPNGATGDDLTQFSIFGGPDGYILDGDTHVTMTGGSVRSIYGTGVGATATELDLGGINGSAYISISGGTVSNKVGASLSTAIEGNFTVEVTGGSIDLVYAAVTQSNYGAGWRMVKGDSTIILTGGTVNTVFGGDGYNPVGGNTTLVATIPVTLDDTYPAAAEGYYENFLYQNGDTWKVKGEVTIPSGATLTIDANESLSGSSSAVINNEGTIVNNGTNNEYKGTVNNIGSINCTGHYYTYECDPTCNICGQLRSGATHKAGDPFLHTDNYLAVNCTYCNQQIGKIKIYKSDSVYNGKEQGGAWEKSGEYTIPTDGGLKYFYSDGTPVNGIPVKTGSYYVAVTAGNVTYKVDFNILKGDLEVKEGPATYYTYGQDSANQEIHAKVVLAGTNTEVTGVWTREWAGMYLKAKFTPTDEHAAHVNELGLLNITHNMSPATPMLTASSPSPSIMPGMTIRMNVDVEMPYQEFNILPASVLEHTITYKIGESGTPVTVDGLEFTLPTTGVALGDTVYVTVNNKAYLGYYTASSSNTVELFVGQVDYSQIIEDLEKELADLETQYGTDVSALEAEIAALKSADQTTLTEINAITQSVSDLANAAATKAALEAVKNDLQAQLDALDSTYATDADVQGKVDAIQAQIDALDSTYATDADVADIQNQINQMNATLATKTELEAAKNALQTQIDTLDQIYATDVDVQNKIDVIQDQIDKLDDTYATDADVAAKVATIQAQIDALKTDLEDTKTDLDNTKTDLDNTKTDLDNTKTDLENTKDNLEQAKKDIDTRIATLDGVVFSALANLQSALEDAQKALEKAIADGDKELADDIAALEKSLTEAKTALETADAALKAELEGKIADGDKTLDDKIATLNQALDVAVAALEATDAANKAALEGKMATFEEALDAFDKALSDMEKELDDTRKELKAKDDALQTFVIIVCVISSVGFVGSGAFATWFFINRKRKI